MAWYEYPSNFSNGSSVDGFGSFIKYTSYITNDWLGTGIILLIWIVIFGLSMAMGSRKALLTSSFISFIFSIYFVRLGMIHPVIVITLIILTIIGAIGSKEEVTL